MTQFENEILLEAITGKPREYIYAHPEIEQGLNKKQKEKLEVMKKQLSKGVPLAYVLGYKWFFEHQLVVNKHTLIPRPETETLVELARDWAKRNKPTVIFDVGTGTGAIAIALASMFKKTKVIGTDISPKALLVAKKNLKKSKLKNLNLVKGNLLLPLEKEFKVNNMEGILLCSNLPYLTKKQLKEKTIAYEPKLALYGGKDDFNKIEQLLKQLSGFQKKYGLLKNSAVFLETNYNHSSKVKKAVKKHLPNGEVEVLKDLSGFERISAIYFN